MIARRLEPGHRDAAVSRRRVVMWTSQHLQMLTAEPIQWGVWGRICFVVQLSDT